MDYLAKQVSTCNKGVLLYVHKVVEQTAGLKVQNMNMKQKTLKIVYCNLFLL